MKKYILFIILLIFLECRSQNIDTDYNFTYHHISYVDNKVFDEYIYDSKTKVYISREMKDFASNEIEEKKIHISIKIEKLQKLHHLYLLLKMANPNQCIYNRNNSNEILDKSIIRFYSNEIGWEDENCNIEMENVNFNHLWGAIEKTIASEPEYKEAFEFIGK